MTPRPHISDRRRAAILRRAGGLCYRCQIPVGCRWDVEHMVARGLFGSDDDDNLAPIHPHACHKPKTAHDRALMAKADRVRRYHTGEHQARKRRRIPSRPFPDSMPMRRA